MQRTQTRLRISFGLVAMAVVLAMVAFMTMVSSNGTTSVSADLPAGAGCPATAGDDGAIGYNVTAILPANAAFSANGVCIVLIGTGGANNTAAISVEAAGCVVAAVAGTPNAGSNIVSADWGANSCVAPGDRVTIKFKSGAGPLTINSVTWRLSDGNTLAGTGVLCEQGAPKPCDDGNLSGISDLQVRQGAAGGIEQFQCITRTDHDSKTNAIKTASVCYINYSGAGDPAVVSILDREIPCFAPFPTSNPPYTCDSGGADGVNCAGVLDCSDPLAGDPIIGPPPPPPYTTLAPQKGLGFYDPAGTSPECASITGGAQPCSATYSCFADIGAGNLGPNLGTLAITPNPLTRAPNDIPITKVKLVKGISNDDCDNLTFPVPGNLYGGLQIVSTDADSTTPVAYRTQNTGCQADYTLCDYDGDGCTDFQELAKPGLIANKGCGDDPWNPSDSNRTDWSGSWSIGVRVLRAGTTPGNAGIYFSCLADMVQTGTGKTAGDLTARAYCYTDNFIGVVNLQGYPGVTGDGFPGGSPPYGAIPADGAPETNCSRGLINNISLDEDNDGTPNDGCPSGGFGDVDSKHTVLTGLIDNGDNHLHLSGCFEDEDASASVGTVYTELSVNKDTGQGTADIWTNQVVATCNAGAPFGTYDTVSGEGKPNGAFNDADVQMVRQPGGQLRDSDTDGIPNAIELRDNGTSGTTGVGCGLRDPFNPYDWYDVNQDGVIDLLNDILGVIQHYSPAGGGPYDVNWDRPPSITGGIGHWNRGEPDGVIDLLNDILGVIQQYHPGPC